MAVLKYRDPVTGKFKRVSSGSGAKEVVIAEITGVQTLDDNTLALLTDNTSYIRFNGGIYRLFSISAPTKTYVSIVDNSNKRIIVDFTAKTCEYSETSIKTPELVGTDGITIDKAADSDRIEISGKNFVEKVPNQTNFVYSVFGTAKTPTIKVDHSNEAHAQRLPLRDVGGSFYIPDAAIGRTDYNFAAGQEAVNKKYVDDNFVAKITTTGKQLVYGINANGVPVNYTLSISSASIASGAIPKYYSIESTIADTAPSGNGIIVTSTPTKKYHAANKKYVDDAIKAAGTGTKLYEHIISFRAETEVDSEDVGYACIRSRTTSESPILPATDDSENSTAVYEYLGALGAVSADKAYPATTAKGDTAAGSTTTFFPIVGLYIYNSNIVGTFTDRDFVEQHRAFLSLSELEETIIEV